MDTGKKMITVTMALTLAFSSVAIADRKNETESVSVDVRGLDLTTAEGMQVFKSRVKRAANKVCGERGSSAASLHVAMHNRVCYRNAVAEAMNSIETYYQTAQRGSH